MNVAGVIGVYGVQCSRISHEEPVMRRLQLLPLGLVCLVLALSGVRVVAQESTTLTILEVVYQDQFPDMEVKLRYLDGQQNPIQDFTNFEVAVGGRPVTTSVDVTPEQGPLAVAMVADLSTRMRDAGTPHKTNRFADMQSLLQEQIILLQRPDLQASLVVFTDTVNLYFPMSDDIGGLRNIINGSVAELPFAPQSEEANGEAYPLAEAIMIALAQLEQVPAEVPRALFVFAAGNPDISLDMDGIQQAVADVAAGERILRMTVVALGSDQEGTFTSFAAAPVQLEQLAAEADGTYFHYFAADVPTTFELQTEIKTHFEQILQLADYYRLRFEADPTLVGNQEVQVSAGSVVDTFPIDIAAVPPRVRVIVDSRDFQGRVRMSIEPDFVQGELTHVEYLLDNRRIGESDSSPDFVHEIDAYSDAFQQQFPTGDYELVAAVRDAQGQVNRSAPLLVEVFQRPPPASLMDQIRAGVTRSGSILLIALVAILAIAGIGTYVVRRSRMGSSYSQPIFSGKSATSKQSDKLNEDDEVTSEVDNDLTAMFSDEEQTQSYNTDELTQRFNETVLLERRFRVVVEQGLDANARKEFQLRSSGAMHYFIGRPSANSLKQPDIVLPDKHVSREHAKLVMLANGDVQLIGGDNENGTFIGDGDTRRRLEPRKPENLKPGDVFWISPAVKLRLVEED
jgi:hypothetical protein